MSLDVAGLGRVADGKYLPRIDLSEVDYLHVWIDDGFGQKCACEECIKSKPSDLYVRMLQELDGALAMEFIKLSVEEVDKAVNRSGGKRQSQSDPHAHLDKLEGLLADFAAVCERNLHQPDPCRGRSWYYMRWYKRVVEQLLPVYRAVASNDRRATLQAWKEAKIWLFANEHHYQPVFDVQWFSKTFDKLILDG
jgi:hypothetical protein